MKKQTNELGHFSRLRFQIPFSNFAFPFFWVSHSKRGWCSPYCNTKFSLNHLLYQAALFLYLHPAELAMRDSWNSPSPHQHLNYVNSETTSSNMSQLDARRPVQSNGSNRSLRFIDVLNRRSNTPLQPAGTGIRLPRVLASHPPASSQSTPHQSRSDRSVFDNHTQVSLTRARSHDGRPYDPVANVQGMLTKHSDWGTRNPVPQTIGLLSLFRSASYAGWRQQATRLACHDVSKTLSIHGFAVSCSSRVPTVCCAQRPGQEWHRIQERLWRPWGSGKSSFLQVGTFQRIWWLKDVAIFFLTPKG